MILNETHPVEPITCAQEKGSGESPRRDLSKLFHDRDVLTEKIHLKVEQVLQSEYSGQSDEVKESVLRIHEKIIANLIG